MDVTSAHTCKNCGTSFVGKYCNNCGEKSHAEHDKKFTHLLEESFHFITHLDGKLFTTIKAVFTRPGKLSLDFCAGIRKKYFSPTSFFLFCVVLYLLFPRFEGLNMKLHTYASPQYPFTWFSAGPIKSKMEKKNISFEELAKKYDEKSAKFSKVFLLVLLPMMAIVLYLLFFIRRKYFFDHFIFATEFASLWVCFKFLLLPLVMVIATAIDHSTIRFFDDANRPLWIGLEMLFLVYLLIAAKRFYQQNWWWTSIKSIVFLFTFTMFITYCYHILLFLTVLFFI